MKKIKNERRKRGKELSFLYGNKTAYKSSFVACRYASRSPKFVILFLEAQDFAAEWSLSTPAERDL
jgi:hypothetical protein